MGSLSPSNIVTVPVVLRKLMPRLPRITSSTLAGISGPRPRRRHHARTARGRDMRRRRHVWRGMQHPKVLTYDPVDTDSAYYWLLYPVTLCNRSLVTMKYRCTQ